MSRAVEVLGHQARIEGCLLGLAVGDALGLPREGLSPRRASRLFGPRPIEHRFLFSRGMCSDDTEHACMVGQALLASGGAPEAFARSLAWRLRGWLLGLPAGVGFATLRAILKLWVGFPPNRSGVFSAGNGPVMRAPLLGVLARPGTGELEAWVRASTRLTHTDPLAEEGALLVAWAAHAVAWREEEPIDAQAVLAVLQARANAPAFQKALQQVGEHLATGSPCAEFAAALGCAKGITGFVLHTVPAALYCWLKTPHDFRAAVEETIELGGDADTTAAIVGGLAGAGLGASAIPSKWLEGMVDWPRSVAWVRELGRRLDQQFPPEGDPAIQGSVPLLWPVLPARNLFFLAVVLGHGVRRIFPPY